MRNDSLKTFCQALKAADHFLLSSHMNPEGDAIGSLVAIESLLRRLGKKTKMVNEDAFPERLYCLPHKDRWNAFDQLKGKTQKFFAAIITDCPNLERIGKVQELITPGTVIFNIDHHISNTRYGHHNFVNPNAAASGELVFEILKHFKLPLTKEEATALYVSLSTDTGSFKYGNTNTQSHRIAAELLETGIDIEKINNELYATYSLNKIQLYSRLLAKVQMASEGKVAWAVLTRADLESSGATYEDTEGFIDFLKYLKEVKVAFFVSEMKDHQEVKVSFRAKEDYDVNQIATAFGGGGHKKAAGCSLKMPIKEATETVLKEILKQCRFK